MIYVIKKASIIYNFPELYLKNVQIQPCRAIAFEVFVQLFRGFGENCGNGGKCEFRTTPCLAIFAVVVLLTNELTPQHYRAIPLLLQLQPYGSTIADEANSQSPVAHCAFVAEGDIH